MTIKTGPAAFTDVRIVEDLAEADYHAHEDLSSTKLRKFMSSPQEYYAIHEAETIEPPKKTAAMAFGTLVHELVFEPSAGRYAIGPNVGKRTKAWAKFEMDCARDGRYGVSEDDHERARTCVDSLQANDIARMLLWEANGATEETVFATHEETGIKVRAKLDRRLVGDVSAIGDLKTAVMWRPSEFPRAMLNGGYDIQIALYHDLAAALRQVESMDAFFVVVNPNPPHEVVSMQVGMATMLAGRDKYERGLRDFAACKASGDWRCRESREVVQVDLPVWALKND